MLTINVLASPGTPTSRQCPRVKIGGEDLLDHVVLADDDLLQFFLHQPAVLAELLQDVSETTGLTGQGSSSIILPTRQPPGRIGC